MLSPRERQVLTLLMDGSTNDVIGDQLGIRASTVKFHVARLCAKLGVDNRTQAVVTGLRRGLIAL